MTLSLAICVAMLGQTPGASSADRAVLAQYQAQKAAAGRDADAQVRLALWCEEHGLSAERAKHLALAVERDPANTVARGLMGMVAYQGKWRRPEEVAGGESVDPAAKKLLADYHERRARTPRRAETQLELARWCKQSGLTEQAMAHFSEVVRLDPSRDSIWKQLGYQKSGNGWVKPEELAARKAEAELQKRADLLWKPRLQKLRAGLESTSPSRRDKARDGLAEISDPRAVPMVCQILSSGDEHLQLAAVRVLGQIDGPAASTALASMAVSSEPRAVRDAAAATLTNLDPRDVVGRLISLIHRPYKYSVHPGSGPGTTGELLVDGESFNLQRLYRFSSVDARTMPYVQLLVPQSMAQAGHAGALPLPLLATYLSAAATRIAGLTAQNEAMLSDASLEQNQRNDAVQQGLAADIEQIESVNHQLRELNDRVLPVLKSLTGVEFGADPDQWKKWWTDQQGYVYQSSLETEKPTYSDAVSLPDVTVLLPQVNFAIPQTHSCFGAGTPVHTSEGLKAIDFIQVGDRVLSQDTTSGLLAFRAVLATHKNPPAPTFRIMMNGEPIVSTGIHRFWKLGKGWTMARELKAGDRLRMVGGIVTIDAITPDQTQPVYNLDVADSRDFFVGKAGLLVHDFSFVQPVLAPFDHILEVALNAATAGTH